MNGLLKTLTSLCIGFTLTTSSAIAATTTNQTDDLSPILPAAALPFRVQIERANFTLPQGVHSGVLGIYKGKWILIAGRLNGLHGFGPAPFPIEAQNTSIFVIDPETGITVSRSLSDSSSGLTQAQIDTLSVTSPEGYQEGDTLYMAGGYGIDTASNDYSTKPVLTAIYLPGIVQWVTQPNNKNNSVIKNIKQLYNPIFQITGGRMFKLGNLTNLVFGQNFTGPYTTSSNGEYSQQIRQFKLTKTNDAFGVDIYPSIPHIPDPNYRRRDLNIMPVLLNHNNLLQYSLVAYAGVFTPATGIWTVPVVIDSAGNSSMADPNLPSTFKQAMNHYYCATAGLYSKKNASMYNIFFGGLSYGYYDSGVFTTDPEIPFLNQVTTVKIDKNNVFTQYLMDAEYPEILSTTVNPGNRLLFGTAAYFVLNNISQYDNRVINLDNIRQPTVIGYIVGGIASTVPNTTTGLDSSASPYVFKVTLIPTG